MQIYIVHRYEHPSNALLLPVRRRKLVLQPDTSEHCETTDTG